MGVPSKKIGWSVEANLMWEIAKELDQTIKVAGKVPSTTTTTTTAP